MSIRFLVASMLAGMLLLPVPPAAAATLIFETTLSGAAEDPPNDSPGTGFSRLTFDSIADTLGVFVEFEGLLSPSFVAHIHAPTAEPFEGNVGVAIQAPTLTGFPVGVTAGTYFHTFDLSEVATYSASFLALAGGTVVQAKDLLILSLIDGQAYFNLHTNQFPAGEIRGFYAVVPLPAGLPLFLTALGGLALLRLKRRALR